MKKKYSDYKFIISKNKESEFNKLTSYLQKQKNISQTVRLALLLAQKQFGDVDLNDALNNLAINDIVATNNADRSKKKSMTSVTKLTQTDTTNKSRQHGNVKENQNIVQPKLNKKNKEIKGKKNITKSKTSKKSNLKSDSSKLSSDVINKMLWDGNSSNL